MTLIAQRVPAESGHWYAKDGTPAYEIVGSNGKVRPTTLRDARKHGLVPSVTTIIGMAAKPGLDRWKQEQVLLAALTLPRREGEPEQEYLARILDDSKQQARDAADAGTAIHASVECAFAGRRYDPAHEVHVDAVRCALGTEELAAEVSFAHPLGFGGKVDLSSPLLVADVKTKEFTAEKAPQGYDEHLMQVAAYRVGLGYEVARCCNVFVSRSEPGLVHTIWWDEEDLQRGWLMFASLLAFWKAKNGVV